MAEDGIDENELPRQDLDFSYDSEKDDGPYQAIPGESPSTVLTNK